jgi:hypothetical protein
MILTHNIDGSPFLEHDDVTLDITADEYEKMRYMNASSTNLFLWHTVLPRLRGKRTTTNQEGEAEKTLKRWLNDGLFRSKPKEILSCPRHCGSSEQSWVETVSFDGNDFIADLPNLGIGRRVLITSSIFDEVKRFWEEDRTALLDFSGRGVRADDVLTPTSVKVVGLPE